MRKSVSLSAALVTALLIGVLIGIQFANPAASSITIEPKSFIETSYVVWKEDSTYYSKDGLTGEISYSADFSYVVNSGIQGLPSSGGRIHIMSGEYILSSTILINKENVTLLGDGPFSTWITSTATYNLTTFIDISKKYVTIEDIGLRGDPSAGYPSFSIDGIKLSSSAADHVNIRSCYIGHFQRYGIYASGGNNILWIEDNYIGVWGRSDGTQGASIMLSGSADSHILDNQLGGARWCLYVSSGAYLTIEGNKMFGAFENYMFLSGPRHCDIVGNTIGGGTPYADLDSIYFVSYSSSYGYNNVISSNVIYGSATGRDGIRLKGPYVQNNTIMGNMIEDCPGIGVHEYDGTEDNNIISNNNFVNCSTPLELEGANTIARGNRFDSPHNHGVATLASGSTFLVVNVTYLRTESIVLLTTLASNSLDTGEFIKLESVDPPSNCFTVKCGDEGTASTDISFYYEVFN